MPQLSLKHIKSIIKPRQADSHKGTHGHALIIAGNVEKMGAAVIAARACLRSGTGLLTANIPKSENSILQIAIPEAMLMTRENADRDYSPFSALGIGPGIGISKQSKELLNDILNKFQKPILLDADALNIIATDKKLFSKIPKGTIITPHPKEFDRLFGIHKNSETRIKTAKQIANDFQIIVVLKGSETLITSGKESFLNSTGNAGLAKGGSGDALTGIINAFLAQGYCSLDAAKLGVYIHGLAADIALENQSLESMLITDVIECLGKAFNIITSKK